MFFRLGCVVYFISCLRRPHVRCSLGREMKEIRKYAKQTVKCKSHICELGSARIRNRKEACVPGVMDTGCEGILNNCANSWLSETCNELACRKQTHTHARA